MGTIATALKHMLAANMPVESIVNAVAEMEAALQVDEQAERRRAADRERHRLNRLRKSADSAEQPDVPRASVTHVEDKTSNLEIEPQEKKVPVKRALRLPEDWTLPVEWRADALKAGLPQQLIDLEAEKMRDWSRSAPKGAKTEWRPAWRNWCREAAGRLGNQRAGPSGRPAKPDHFKDYARELNDGQERDDRGGGGHWDDAQGFPLRTIEHH